MGTVQTALNIDTQAMAGAIKLVDVAAPKGLDALVRSAIAAIRSELEIGSHLAVAYSGGKDSSVTLALTLMAMEELLAEGFTLPTLHVLHSDTQVENPVVAAYNKRQLRQIRRYAKQSALPIKVWVATPSLSQDYLVSLIGGRTIASVGNNTKCQQMMKAAPLGQIKAKVRKSICEESGKSRKEVRVVSVIGTRFDESAQRARNMEQRGESADQAVELAAASGDLVLSPVAHFTTMDVFEFIGRVRSGQYRTYDKWDDLVEVYRDMNGGDCMVIAYMAKKEVARPPCSARTGCWTCLRVSRDASAENMIASEDGRFGWMKPLNDLRNYIMARHFDPSARCWLGRSVNEENGTVKIQPNAYSPEFTKELLGIVLTMQRNENIQAAKLGVEPRFHLLSLQQVIAIDMLWARYGYQKPFTAMRMLQDIEDRGVSYSIPSLDGIPAFTAKDVTFTAEVPFCDESYNAMFSGLRNLDHAVADAETLKVMNNGVYMTQANEGDCFDIDEEGAWLFYEFELEHALERVSINDAPADAVHYLLGLGTVQLFKGGAAEWDRMLRMSNQIHRHELQPILHDPMALLHKLGGKVESAVGEQLSMF